MRDTRSSADNRRRSWRLILVGAVLAAAVWPAASLASDRFRDVPSGHGFHADIAWLADAGVTRGCNPPVNDRFCPGDPVTRAQMAAFMRRLAESAALEPAQLTAISPLQVANGQISIAPLTATSPVKIAGRNISVEPLTATSGLRATGQQISLDPPIRVTKNVDGETQATSSVISANNTNMEGGGKFGIHGRSNRGSAVGPGAGVVGRGYNGAYGMLGEAGDLTLIAQPIGEVGVVGRGQNRGTYGSSQVGIGVYGVSSSNYGVWGQSTTWRGVTGRTGLASNDWGVYTPDNSFALNYQLQGAVMVVVENGGDSAIDPGDVVSFSGVTDPTATYEAPMPQVSRADASAGAGIAGVVFSRFNVDSLLESDAEDPVPTGVESTIAGPVPPGGHLLLVVSGAARTNIDTGQAIAAGQVLGLSAEPGRATELSAAPGSDSAVGRSGMIGTALESADENGLAWVFVGSG